MYNIINIHDEEETALNYCLPAVYNIIDTHLVTVSNYQLPVVYDRIWYACRQLLLITDYQQFAGELIHV